MTVKDSHHQSCLNTFMQYYQYYNKKTRYSSTSTYHYSSTRPKFGLESLDFLESNKNIMENIPLNVRYSRTMDVLQKFQKVPTSLKDVSKEAISNLIIKSLWKNQCHSEASTTSPASVYIQNSLEEELRLWIQFVPARVKEEILQNTAKLLISNLGTVGYRSGQHHHSYNPLPVLIASCFEILYDTSFKSVELFNELQWSKESRGKVLHLIHKNLNTGVTSIDFACYKSPHYGLTSVAFSEKFILATGFNKLPNLKTLHLPNTCDDDILAKIADCCPLLEDLNIAGSFGVTDLGVQWFCTGNYNPNHLYHHGGSASSLPDNRKVLLQPSKRVGFQATPMIQFGQSMAPEVKKEGQILTSIKKINFTGTSINSKSLEMILSSCKKLQKLVIEDDIWNQFFNLFQINEESNISSGCIDCVGPCPFMLDINMATNVANHLESIQFIFPNLSHLVLNKPLQNARPDTMMTNLFTLSEFENLNSLTLKDVQFDNLGPFLQDLGPRLTNIFLSGKSTIVNLERLNSTCPNLQTLGITYSTLTSDELSDLNMFENLKVVKLWDVHVQANDHSWKRLLKCAKNLEKLYLWNLVINDDDLLDIMNFNPWKQLQDARIGCSEIGFVRLTDDSVTRLIKHCPVIKTIGGICDWKTRDLLTLLQSLMVEGGWKITLENQSSNFT